MSNITSKDFENNIIKIQPYYYKLVNKFSKSYLSGSEWYVGDDLLLWWRNYNVRYFQKKLQKLKDIISILIIEKENNF
jgi:hypothetical protein